MYERLLVMVTMDVHTEPTQTEGLPTNNMTSLRLLRDISDINKMLIMYFDISRPFWGRQNHNVIPDFSMTSAIYSDIYRPF